MIKVDSNLCVGCGLCTKICPFTILELKNGNPVMTDGKEKGCILCMHCVSICPKQALSFDGIPNNTEEAKLPKANSYEEMKNLIMSNRSIRHFSYNLVPLEEIKEILSTVDFAPSAKNQHPNKWVLVYGPNKVQEIMSLVVEFVKENNVSKEILSELEAGNNIVTLNASHLLFGVAPKEGCINPYTDIVIANTDVDLLLHSKNIGSCWTGYLNRIANASPKIKKLLGIDDSMQIYSALAFGYPKGEKYERLPKRNMAEISIVTD